MVQQLIGHGLNISKEDNFGRTPLYYALASTPYDTENNNKHIDIKSLINSGAKLKKPKGNHHFHPSFTNFCAVADCISNDGCNFFDPENFEMLTCLVKSFLQQDINENEKWVEIHKKLGSFCMWNNDGQDIINLYQIIEISSSDLGIRCKLPQSGTLKDFNQNGCRNYIPINTLKFLLGKGYPLDKTHMVDCLHYALKHGHEEEVSFLLSIGIKPKKTAEELKSANVNKDLKLKVEDARKNPSSLENICRLQIHNSLNIENAVKKVPEMIGELIKFEW